MAWSLESGDADIAQRIAAALTWFWSIRRHVAEAVEWFDRVLAAEGDSPEARASALVQAGFINSFGGDHDLDACRALIGEAQSRFADLGRHVVV